MRRLASACLVSCALTIVLVACGGDGGSGDGGALDASSDATTQPVADGGVNARQAAENLHTYLEGLGDSPPEDCPFMTASDSVGRALASSTGISGQPLLDEVNLSDYGDDEGEGDSPEKGQGQPFPYIDCEYDDPADTIDSGFAVFVFDLTAGGDVDVLWPRILDGYAEGSVAEGPVIDGSTVRISERTTESTDLVTNKTSSFTEVLAIWSKDGLALHFVLQDKNAAPALFESQLPDLIPQLVTTVSGLG
jgi:hypothetical protein